MNQDQETSNMIDEADPDEVPEENQEENRAEKAAMKRTVRRVVAAPTPAALAERRAKRLHECQLANSRAIANELTVWDGEQDLEIPIIVETDFDGQLLAKYYRDNGWPHCLYVREVAEEGGLVRRCKLVFSVNDTVQVDAPVGDGRCEDCGRAEHTPPCLPTASGSDAGKPAAKASKASKASKKSAKRTSSK